MNWKSDKTGKANPRLKASFLEVVENQLKANDPPETKQTLDRLIDQGISRDDAIIYIAQAVCTEVWDVLRKKNPYNGKLHCQTLLKKYILRDSGRPSRTMSGQSKQ